MLRTLLLLTAALIPKVSHAECNISNLLYGKVRVEMIEHKDADNHNETGIIFGDDFDSKRFSYGRILGQIDPAERDGSRRIVNTDLDLCGRIGSDLVIDTQDADCSSCDKKAEVRLQRIGKTGFAVMSNGSIMGTLSGHLPRQGRF